MEKIFSLFSDTLSKLYLLLPNIIFAFMIDVKVGLGTLHTALPFILLYSFQKMGVFTLNSFGKITNYTKVLRLNLGVALGGVFLAIIGTLFKQQILLDLSGILVGTGLSCLPTLIKKGLLFKSSKLGLVFSILIALLVGVNIKYFSNLFNLYLLALLLLMTLMASFYLPAPKTQMLAQLKLDLRSFVPAGIILCLYVMIRTYRQTALIADFEWMLIFSGIIFLFFLYQDIFRIYEQTYQFWLGALKNFLIIYSLFWFFIRGQVSLIIWSFIILMLSNFLGTLLYHKLAYPNVTIQIGAFLGIVCGLLLMLSSRIYLVGYFITALSAMIAGKANTNDGLLPDKSGQIKTLGSLLQQVCLGLTIELVSLWQLHSPTALLYSNVYNQAILKASLPDIIVSLILIS
ncbi:MAG: hypothetical protein K2O72_07470, partial [Ligilactobacillus sp.]|nr:hypothetical protein [Ligilactobacillus sp.]